MLKAESGGIVVLSPRPELELVIVLSFLHNLFPPIDNQNRHVSSPPATLFNSRLIITMLFIVKTYYHTVAYCKINHNR